jgi:hypothetical protein
MTAIKTTSESLAKMTTCDAVKRISRFACRFTFAKGFFYRHESTPASFACQIKDQLQAQGFDVTLVEAGTKNAPFRGGQSVWQESHFHATFDLSPKSGDHP